MKKVFKNIICSVIFVALLASMLLAASAIVRPGKTAQVNALEDPLTNGMLAEKENTIDILFLGDSEAYSTFIPLEIWSKFGITSYVCGTSDQVLSFSYELMTKTFKKQNPKLVVLETNTIFREASSANTFINRAGGLFSVFKYHDRWKRLQPKSWSLSENKTYDERSKGYLFNTSRKPASTDGYMEPCDESESIFPQNEKYVKKIKDYCRKNGAQLILTSVPSTKNWNYKKHNAIAELAKRLSVEYVDMNTVYEQIGIDWNRDTRDGGDHLNYFGASKATEYFGNYVAKKNIFSDKRNEKTYENWNDFAEDFNKKIDEFYV